MDAFAVLADRYAKSTLPDLAHSALPNAPQQPYRPRWRPLRQAIATVRRQIRSGVRPVPVTSDCTAPPVRSPGAIPGG